MSKNKNNTTNGIASEHLQSDKEYQIFLNEIKARLKSAQFQAAIIVNRELIEFYWGMGCLIIERQENAKWGDKLFDALARDLRQSFPNTEGFSKTNLKNMRLFAKHYPDKEFSQALPDQLTWTHHVVLIQNINSCDLHIKRWYANKTLENGWPYRELLAQIKADLYSRQGALCTKTTNFSDKLPSSTSLLAQEMIKDPYKFHFLTVGEDAHEKDVHNGLIGHMKQFLMELGQGFALYSARYEIRCNAFQIGLRFQFSFIEK